MIINGNWTEWSVFWAKIICMISKLNECEAGVRFEITSMISDQNRTTWGSIITLLHPFWNHPNTGLVQFKYFLNVILNQFEIKFIHFLGGKIRVLETSCKICHIFHFPAIWSVTLNKPWNLIGYFVFSVGSSLARKKMPFKAKNGVICE